VLDRLFKRSSQLDRCIRSAASSTAAAAAAAAYFVSAEWACMAAKCSSTFHCPPLVPHHLQQQVQQQQQQLLQQQQQHQQSGESAKGVQQLPQQDHAPEPLHVGSNIKKLPIMMLPISPVRKQAGNFAKSVYTCGVPPVTLCFRHCTTIAAIGKLLKVWLGSSLIFMPEGML
jgi:hypothetical protein